MQDALISGYVMFFGLLMCAFAVGASHEGLRLWFGFLHTPHGQLAFLLVAGNLTWVNMVKVSSLAVTQLALCASSGRVWRLWAARYSQSEAQPLGAQPPPQLLD